MPEVAHKLEPAPTGRAKCRGCDERIAAGELRFGEVLPNPFADGDMTHWFHPECAAYKRPEPLLALLESGSEAVPDAERLIAEAKRGIEHPRLPRVNGVERDPSGRALCRSCKAVIAKGVWRIPLVFYEEGRFSPAGFLHVPCAPGYFETGDLLARMKRFSGTLSDDDLKDVEAVLSCRT